MIVEFTAGAAQVREADDCTRLDVATSLEAADLDTVLAATGTGTRDGENVLLDVGALRERARAAAAAPDWESRWAAMIDYAARKGWLSLDGTTVQAHIEQGR